MQQLFSNGNAWRIRKCPGQRGIVHHERYAGGRYNNSQDIQQYTIEPIWVFIGVVDVGVDVDKAKLYKTTNIG